MDFLHCAVGDLFHELFVVDFLDEGGLEEGLDEVGVVVDEVGEVVEDAGLVVLLCGGGSRRFVVAVVVM